MTTELHISGVLPSSLYGATIERLSSYCERGEAFTSNEEVFARSAGESNGGGNAGAGLQLRVKALRTRSSGDATQWSLQINGRPEPVRTAPRAQQYGVTELLVEDGSDPRVFAHALGYGKSLFTLRRRGVVFHRANVSIELFQLYDVRPFLRS
ncbi:hypothetical protein Rhopal_007164-T1 [Rhodotorula paludigena]|uniref:Uncharacterized protein n=1 Tax=Rhodotorula paludigena TaxID=86838 RepID=A0AAV5GVW2_9BASI|nr:hypothetical protein Rhopal_007164-T1 [Rhodotorula paludigena]